ncbi:MAG: hypothetical protein ABWZ80_05990 [Beijerinckiaceae bacterium]
MTHESLVGLNLCDSAIDDAQARLWSLAHVFDVGHGQKILILNEDNMR